MASFNNLKNFYRFTDMLSKISPTFVASLLLSHVTRGIRPPSRVFRISGFKKNRDTATWFYLK